MTGAGDVLLSVRGLTVDFETEANSVRILDSVSFELHRQETLGVVGESGSGKSLLATALLRLVHHPGKIVGGEIVFDGADLMQASPAALSTVRGRRIALIPQDASLALNPVLRVGDQLSEVIRRHVTRDRSAIRKRIREVLTRVGLSDVDRVTAAYPGSLSGGMKQRVAIALALATAPELLIADDPTSAVDVTIQAQILGDLVQLTEAMGLTTIFISHDLRVISSLCSRVVSLYAGQVTEIGPAGRIVEQARHPYTSALVTCTPTIEKRVDPLPVMPGSPVGAQSLPGCRFHPRCPRALDQCRRERPALDDPVDGVACFNPVR